mmetsp:Transcript_43366/g.88654  ORF Transcript_43366/g.88654 Transcript_43366/m.88654 type:complete len:206 (+) Transcript_43366:155-772(+)
MPSASTSSRLLHHRCAARPLSAPTASRSWIRSGHRLACLSAGVTTPSLSAWSAALLSSRTCPSHTRRISRCFATSMERSTAHTMTRATTRVRLGAPSSASRPSTCTCLTWRRAARRPSPRTRSGWTRRWARPPTPRFPTAPRGTWPQSQRPTTRHSSTRTSPTAPWTTPACTPAAPCSRASSGAHLCGSTSMSSGPRRCAETRHA